MSTRSRVASTAPEHDPHRSWLRMNNAAHARELRVLRIDQQVPNCIESQNTNAHRHNALSRCCRRAMPAKTSECTWRPLASALRPSGRCPTGPTQVALAGKRACGARATSAASTHHRQSTNDRQRHLIPSCRTCDPRNAAVLSWHKINLCHCAHRSRENASGRNKYDFFFLPKINNQLI